MLRALQEDWCALGYVNFKATGMLTGLCEGALSPLSQLDHDPNGECQSGGSWKLNFRTYRSPVGTITVSPWRLEIHGGSRHDCSSRCLGSDFVFVFIAWRTVSPDQNCKEQYKIDN